MASPKRDDGETPIPARESKGTRELKRTTSRQVRQVFSSATLSYGYLLSLTGFHNYVEALGGRLTRPIPLHGLP
jgi:hypothetical protein